MKRLPYTPNSKIKQWVRKYIWLRSRERNATLKRDNYTCVNCGRKQSRKKGEEVFVEVDHIRGINWEKVIEFIRREVLQTPGDLETNCKDCHTEKHGNAKKDKGAKCTNN